MELVFEHSDIPPPPVVEKKTKKSWRQDKRRKKPEQEKQENTSTPQRRNQRSRKNEENASEDNISIKSVEKQRKPRSDTYPPERKKEEVNVTDLINYERARIRLLESQQAKDRVPCDNEKKHVRRTKSSYTNQHITRPEEQLIEHLTGFMFDYELTYSTEDFTPRQATKPEINQLQAEHIGQIDGQFYSTLSLQAFCSVDEALRHVSTHSHKRARKDVKDGKSITSLSTKMPMSESRLKQLNDEIYAFKAPNIDERIQIFDEVRNLLSDKIEVKMEVYGSTLTGTCMPESDINVQIYHAELRPNKLLSQLSVILQSMGDKFESVQERFYPAPNMTAFTPNIVLGYKSHKLTFIASDAELTPRIKSSRLLKLYLDFEPRLRQCALILRHWTAWCRLDKVDEGTIPAYSFILMLIFAAQQNKWLPVLHELTECRSDKLPILQNNSKWWYLPKKVKKEKDEETITIDMANLDMSDDDEDEDEEEVTVEPVTTEDNPDEEVLDELDETEIELESQMPSSLSAADILTYFFHYFGQAYDMEHKVVSIRYGHILSRGEKGWGARRIAVEDPYMRKRNVCRSMCSQAAFDYMRTRMRITLLRLYIGIDEFNSIITSNQNQLNNVSPASTVSETLKAADTVVPKVNKKSFLFGEINQILESRKPTEEDKKKINDEFGEYLKSENENLIQLSNDELGKQLVRVFTEDNIAGGLRPAKTCQLCRAQGHQAKSCPENASRTSLPPLTKLNKNQIKLMDKVLRHVYETNCPSKQEVKHREDALANLSQIIRDEFDDGIQLVLFGSSRNGFGFKGSDMDLCLSFTDSPFEPPAKYDNPVQVIKTLAKIFDQRSEFRSVNAICAAKVPIVKFEYTFSGVTYEGDISYYNILAQRNTKLLHFYSSFDKRCKILGYVLKSMAKLCGVADASRGSISSYGYTLLLIHYLQHVKVLPCLQELSLEQPKPSLIVETFDTWFQDDMNVIDQLFQRENKDSLAELWVGMLQYYTEQFQFDRHLVQIRQYAQMTTFEKEWTSKCISIEDPFELSHNLGSGISRKMANFIVKMLQRTRSFFGTFNENIFAEHNWNPDTRKLSKACFSSSILTDGEEVPNDRCCRTCGKIGHFSKDCPRSRKNMKKLMKDPNYIQEMTAMKCFVCQQTGHIAKQCSQRGQPRHHRGHHNNHQKYDKKRPKAKTNEDEKGRYNHGNRRYRNNWRNHDKNDTERTEREIKKLIGVPLNRTSNQ